jgi:pimeloyl-ACP methyl ester carboxylesterase
MSLMSAGTVGLLEELPDRFNGFQSDLRLRVRLHAGRANRDVVIDGGICRIERCNGEAFDAEIVTSAETWRAIHEGRLSGIEAFARKKLLVRGSFERSLEFETLFDRPRAGGLVYEIANVDAGGVRISTLIAGDRSDPPLLLLHGLGATKVSWVPAVPLLAQKHCVIVPDLPGFGASEKPRGVHSARWFAGHALALMDAMGYERMYAGGHSMGGRIATEMAMLEPDRTLAVVAICPVTVFDRPRALRIARLARPELGWFLTRLPRTRVENGLRSLFADPSHVDDDWYEVAADDFLRRWKSAKERRAFASSLRRIYLDKPFGRSGFWARLALLEPPALFVYGRDDVVIRPALAEVVAELAPHVRLKVWEDCGHVPQLEYPERTATAMLDFFSGGE